MSKAPKYSLGQTVVNLVSKRGSYEPSTCRFSEHELVSLEEYKSQLCVEF